MHKSRLARCAGIGTVSLALAIGVAPAALAAPAPTAVHTAPVLTRPAHPSLSVGSRGASVTWVQTTLGVRPRTGYFGPITKAAVTRFQKTHHLRATGVVNAATWTVLAAAAQRADISRVPDRASRSAPRAALATGAHVVAVAADYAGVRYSYGGASPSAGFDCSGYVGYVYRQLGITLPRSAAGIYARVERISKAEARPGDLVFVHKNGRISHVAIYGGDSTWWEASRPGTPSGKRHAWSSHVSYGRVLG